MGENALELAHTGKSLARYEATGHLDCLARLGLAPRAQRREILEGEPQRIHALVARIAQLVLTVHRQHLTQLRFTATEALGGILQRRHIRRRRRRWRAQNVFEHKQSTLHRGCARRIRRNGQHRPVGENATTRAARRQFHEP